MRPVDAWPRYGELKIPAPGDFPRNPDLERLVRESPDRDALLVWADWLHEQGDARGLALHLLASRAGRDHVVSAWAEHHRPTLCAPFDDAIFRVSLWGPLALHLTPWRMEASRVADLLDAPLCARLQSIASANVGATALLQGVAARSRPSTLSEVAVQAGVDEPIATLWRDLWGIRSLWLSGAMQAGALDLPDLQILHLNGHLGPIQIDAREVPVRELSLRMDVRDAAELLRTHAWPQLVRLTMETHYGEVDLAGLRAVLRSPVVGQIEHLTFRAGLSDGRVLGELTAAASDLASLRVLEAQGLSGDLAALVKESLPEVEMRAWSPRRR